MRNLLSFLTRTPVVAALLVALGVAAEFVSGATVQIWSFLLVNVLLAQSINLLTGVAGQISLGHAGFLGIGAYGSALLMKNFGLPLPLTLLAGAAMGAVSGWLLSFAAGRVREFYLAMMTLGFGMIFYEVVREWTSVTGGMMGLSGVPSPGLRTLTLFGWSVGPTAYFQIMLAVVAGVVWLLRNFVTSPFGRAFFAIHVSEVAAGSIGVPRARTKRNAYMLSAALAGLAGGFYAHLVGYLGPETFGLHRSVEVLVMAVVGGLGTLAGPVLGAVVFTYLPEKLQIFAEYQFMVYGLILLLSFVLLPRGLAGLLLPRPRFAKDVAPLQAPPPAAPKASSSRGPLLSAEGVSISFLGLRALDNASVTVGVGEILGLVGPNGSGKSTLVNIISGIYRPGDGRVTFDGAAITGLPDHAVARRGALRTFQDPRLVPAFTVRENVLLGGHRLYRQNPLAAALNLPGALREDATMLGRADAIIAMAGLSHLADTPVRDLPYGDQRMTELSRVILADPRLVMLDEPAAGLSEVELQRLGGLVRHLKERGVGVILIEHHMDFLNELVDRVVVLDSGRVIYQGGMAGMYRDPAVVAAYLGTETHPGEAVHA
ncbi:amino acid/amide ABC transporter membrane protein 2 (HAAT family) /amino acid/amide ABC transporter ATP-binding protein 1 (HAAT family) [Azospirillum baldaniorum]|uniref:branched-chain amino acid ABC transporter ATP-binding protein/permease n=1 Tax=Azospirillum baldaniorum TaxID=1064539 RepID=UPI00119F0049|nr:branched-chain amino acid ABC transporter ATP-binding protein/permease [Azospirillum baldaniorum]TWA61926.1 amino acid/amide ABC transporter membrane protein 2 (HAAT family) /amino acid/amide ABC transporter ATP-binding protein 1 (HAAT family) [Azospirillum baldaniorum]